MKPMHNILTAASPFAMITVPQLYASVERFAVTSMPFEVLGGNLEDRFFNAPATFAQMGSDIISATFETSDSVWSGLAARYSNPPRVQILSNNEVSGKIDVNAAAD